VKLLRLAFRNALHGKVRAVLTVGSIAVFLASFVFLLTIVTSFESTFERSGRSLRIGVRAASSLAEMLPERYEERLRGLGQYGVTCVGGLTWFGGVIPGREREFFASYAAEVEVVRDMMEAEMTIPDDVWERWRRDPAGAIAGEPLVRRMGWEPGKSRITLFSPRFGVTLTVNLVGAFTGVGECKLLLPLKMLDEALGRPGLVQSFWVKVRSPELIPEVCARIDEMFKDAQVPTKSEPERAYAVSFYSMAGNLLQALYLVGSAVSIVLLLVAGNSMAIVAQSRVREVAVLKGLGFRPGHVVGLLLGEAVVLTGAGGLIGTAAMGIVLRAIDVSEKMGVVGTMISDFRVAPGAAAIGIALSIAIGIAAGTFPALRAARLRVAEGLRAVV